MRSSTVTQHSLRQAGWPAGSTLSCPPQRAPARAAHLVVRAYVTQQNAGTLAKRNGIAIDLHDINSPSVNIVHIERQSQLEKSDLSEVVQKLSSFKCKVS